jgi:PAS domain S-box-containing protein
MKARQPIRIRPTGSASFEHMLGYDRRELIGCPVSNIYNAKEKRERTAENVAAQLDREGEATYEVPLVRKNGGLVWCCAHTCRLEHPTLGTVWVTVDEDITERKASDKERNCLFEMSLDLLAVATFSGVFKRINPAFEDVLGWTLEEMVSFDCLELVHPDDRQATLAAANQLLEGTPLLSFENRCRTKGGSYRWLQWKCTPASENEIVYIAARDVTESKIAKAAMRELSESLETTLLSIGDGVIATNEKGLVQRMNPVAEYLTGWSIAEAKDRPFPDIFKIIDENSRSQLEDPVSHCLRQDTTVDLPKHVLLLRRDGSEVGIADSCAPIRRADGSVHGAVLVFRDLANERGAAEVHAKYKRQLVFADRMASVGTLAAGVAHEINNPLTYITANIDTVIEEIRLLAGGSSSGRLKDIEEVLLEARAGTSRVAKIVRGLKTFSRVDEERVGVVDLVPVLELSVNMALNEIRQRAQLIKEFGDAPSVDADDARLGQVFINLLVNAAQAMPEGKTDVNEIRIVTSTDAEGRAVVEIRDTGPGMAPAVMARIFDPFFTTKPVGVGTGLGLAICHNIVTSMGGEISVQSEVGKGTSFRVVLPASKMSASPVPLPVKHSKDASRRPAKVLVVDDEPAVGFAVRRVLRNHDVTVVTSAKAALDLFAAGKDFDVILSDLMMPGMSGMEFHAALSGLHPRMASRVVFVTGGAFTPEANAFLDRVPNERMEKPFDFLALRAMVQKFVKEPEASGAV